MAGNLRIDGSTARVLLLAIVHVAGCVEHRALPEQYASDCSGCHGDPARAEVGSDHAVNVLQRAAPPFDVQGHTSSSFRKVGAHVAHVSATSLHASIACTACHPGAEPAVAQSAVSIYYFTLSHIDGKTALGFSDAAVAGVEPPTWNGSSCANVYCHNPASASQPNTGASTPEPQWTSSGQIACGSCHGLPPPAPHPAVTGGCSGCHTNVTDSFRFIDVNKHVNGTVDF